MPHVAAQDTLEAAGDAVKYAVDFDAVRYREGAGRDFVPVEIALDGDWMCERYRIPMDRYYRDYAFQQEVRDRARAEVRDSLDLELIGPFGVDQGVVTNASLFGGKVRYPANATPTLEPVVGEPKDVADLERRIDALSDDALLEAGELQSARWRWLRRLELERGVPARSPAGRGTKGVATVCGQLCGVTAFLTWLVTDPREAAALTALVGRTFARYIASCRAHDGLEGADGLGFASDLSGLMSPELYGRFCAPHESSLYERFAPAGQRYYHADSNMGRHVPALRAIGVNAVNIGPMVSTADILEAAPDMVVHGQVPPTQVLWQGSPDLVVDAVRRDVRDMMTASAGPSQLVVTTAGSVNPGTPLENIKALYWAAMEYGRIGSGGGLADPRPDEPLGFDRRGTVMQIS